MSKIEYDERIIRWVYRKEEKEIDGRKIKR